jgi:cysteinyl-tRNA synthetase
MYVCGLTPQSHIHVGHARTFVVFDILRRLLEYRGFKLIYVQNFTDIDDKIIAKSKDLGVHPSEVAEKYIVEYFDVMDKLNVKRAHLYPRVTEHIQDIIEFTKRLIENGHAYESGGDVYFQVNSFTGYGKLSNQKMEDLIAGARVEPNENKRSPEDFALWKRAQPGEPGWNSPWGKGRPGWHIECSALAKKYLGEIFDIHGGGQDLIFPHHENEIAQSESLTGKEPARYWMHVGWVTMGKTKMSKSVGNVINLIDLLQKVDADSVRLALISTHYRSPVEFDEDTLSQAEANATKLKNTFALLKQNLEKKGSVAPTPISSKIETLFADLISNLEQDLDTPKALTNLFEITKTLNRSINDATASRSDLETGLKILREAGEIFGFSLETEVVDVRIEELVKLVLDLREEARRRKDFGKADEIRLKLAQIGILVEDAAGGPRWFYKNKAQNTRQ